MQYHLQWADELQRIERRFLTEIESLEKEIHPEHAPTFTRIIEKKIALLKEILGIVETNPNMTLEDLAELVDHKLETEERALKNAKSVFDIDKIFDSIRILSWVRYLKREKNEQYPVGSDWNED
jgi:hypothetical protein